MWLGRRRARGGVAQRPLFWLAPLLCSLLVPVAGLAQVETRIQREGDAFPIAPDGTVWRIGEELGFRPGGPAGTNLLHSFSLFDLGPGHTALFSANPTLTTDNVIARVVGGVGPSQIHGTLASDIPGADLYFLNPQGIVFGRSAQLDVQGSFFASSADELRLFDDTGASFAAFSEEAPLAVSSPREFGFLGTPASIEVRGSQLEVPAAEGIGLIGGDLVISGRGNQNSLGYLDTSGGRIDLASLGGPGTVVRITGPQPDLRIEGDAPRGDIRIVSGAIVNSSGLDPIIFFPCGAGSCTRTEASRGAGDVFIRARDLQMTDAEIRAMTISLEPAGDVDVELTGELSIHQTGPFTSGIFAGSGLEQVYREEPPVSPSWTEFPFPEQRPRGDNKVVRSFTGNDLEVPVSIRYFTKGPAGNISVEAREVSLHGGSRLSATSFFGGDPGNVEVVADGRVSILGADAAGRQSAIFSNGQGGSGAGEVSIQAEELVLDRGIIVTEARNAPGEPSGRGGDIVIEVDRLEITGNGRIDSSTRGAGDGGDITVVARESIFISGGEQEVPGQERQFSGITAIAQDIPEDPALPGQIGAGGSIEISSASLTLADRAEISARADETSAGGGSVVIHAGEIELRGESLVATSAEGDAFAGDVDIESDLLRIRDSAVSASVSGGTGGGGNIDIESGALVLDSGQILTTGEEGPGGNIRIVSDVLIASPDSVVSARSDSSVDGDVVIESPETKVDEGLPPLNVPFQDPSTLMRASCAARARGGATGSFQVARAEGLPASPDQMLLAFEAPRPEQAVLADAALPASSLAAGQSADTPPVSAPAAPVQTTQTSALYDATAAYALGASAFDAGCFDEAAEELVRSSRRYAAAGQPGLQGEALRGAAESQQAAGRYSASLAPLQDALALAEQGGDPRAMASARGSLGNAFLALGDTGEAGRQLEQAVAIARGLDDSALTARLLVNLGNQESVAGETGRALAHYEESATLARGVPLHLAEAIALSNGARAALAAEQPQRAADLLEQAERVTPRLATTHEKADLWLHLANSRRHLGGPTNLLAAHQALTNATLVARELDDGRSLSEALGSLGELYAADKRADEALLLTRRAMRVAEEANAAELQYRWHWQEGRLLWSQGQSMPALRAYRRAVVLVEEFRPEARAHYGSAAAEFRRAVAPVYVDFVDALLRSSDLVADPADRTRLLVEARATLEQLKAAELRDYFRDECVTEIAARQVDLDRLSREARAAVVYPIVLPDRIELLVSLPAGVERFTVAVPADEVLQTLASYRRALQNQLHADFLEPAGRLYDWLVRPYADQLRGEEVETLVFVPDGPLRQVPMAALYDGRAVLAQRFAIAVAPGLSLVDPKPLDTEGARFLLAGVSDPVQGFSALPNTAKEVEAIHALYGGQALMDEEFEAARFEQELAADAPSVVHLASHAVFTGDPATSFVLTHDDRLSMDELSQVVSSTRFGRQPLELLTLSACETAAGDDRAALGLAGVAIRAGARSVLGSLWAVQDEATYELVVAFYQALKQPGMSKAEALRRAQVKLIEDPRFSHPVHWAPFLLISNWL